MSLLFLSLFLLGRLMATLRVGSLVLVLFVGAVLCGDGCVV